MRPAAACRRAATVLACLIAVAAVSGQPVSAHTEVDFTLPAGGTTVGEPVSEISVAFTDVVALVGNGFEVLDPQGNVVLPFVVTDDDMLYRLQLDSPLAGGPVGVRYEVTAIDGHVIEGSFTFTVAAEAPLPTQPTTAPAPVTTAPATAVATNAPSTTGAATTPPSSTSSSAPTSSVTAGTGGDGSDGDSSSTAVIVVLAAVVLGAGGFLLMRSRRHP